MAELTAASVIKHSMGDLTLHIVKFSSVDAGDYWACEIPGVVDAWASGWAVADTGSIGLGVSVATGATFTLQNCADNTTASLYVLSTS